MTLNPQIKLVPAVWERLCGIEVIDPDGWNRKNMNWQEEAITFDDFIGKAFESTCRWPTHDVDAIRKRVF